MASFIIRRVLKSDVTQLSAYAWYKTNSGFKTNLVGAKT